MKKDKYSAEFSHALQQRSATIVKGTTLQANKHRAMSLRRKHTAEAAKMAKKNNDDEDSFESFDSEGRPSPKMLKKKSLEVTIKASCLSIELRTTDD